MGIFYLFRLYHSLWAFAGENEMQNLIMSCFLSAVVSGVGLNLFKVSGKPVPDTLAGDRRAGAETVQKNVTVI